jgi:predicted transcriptional regulator
MRRVADAMQAPVVAVESATTIQVASARMLEARTQAAVLVDGGRVCGMVTAERLAEALGQGYDAAATRVGVIAERDPLLVEAGDALVDAHERMRSAGRTLVPVVTRDRRPVGMLADST